jgi:CO/xanthine dehydrogenase Mo-binding subunit
MTPELLRRADSESKLGDVPAYVDDLTRPGLLHVALVTAPVPAGRLLGLELDAARALPGVRAILTAADVPVNQVGCVFPDQPLLVAEAFRFVGDRLAVVVADTREQARAAALAVAVAYQALPVVEDVLEALKPGAPLVHPDGNLVTHQRVRKGDVTAALAAAEVVLEAVYQAPYQEHAYLEPQGVLAEPTPDGGLTIHGSMQCPFYVQSAVARALNLPLAAVRVVQAVTGGGFGGKEDYPSEPAACAALAAFILQRPVKLVYERGEDLAWSTKRHRIRTALTLGATREGRVTAVRATLHVDAGAYAGLSTVVSERANISVVGPYAVPHACVDTFVVRTNNLFGGAFRGFGHPQVAWAFESALDELAARLDLTPAEIRLRNVVGPGDTALSGQPLDGSGPIRQVLETALARSGFDEKRKEFEEFNASNPTLKRGVGLGFILYGVGLAAGGQHLEGSGALVQVLRDGSVLVAIGGTEMGQGAYTVMARIASWSLRVPAERVRVLPSDTALVPDSGPTVASRTTLMSGNAVKDAADRLFERLLPVAADLLKVAPQAVEAVEGVFTAPSGARVTFPEVALQAFRRKVKLVESGWYAPPPKPFDLATGQGDAYLVYAAACHVAQVEVDLSCGETRVLKVTAVHDVGHAIHPRLVRDQVLGGVAQGLGYALMEDLQLKGGVPLNPSFTDYLIPTSLDVPEVEVHLVEEPCAHGPYGAKGVGEPSLIPCPAAVSNAVCHATGQRFRELPLTPERVLSATSRFLR